MIAIVKSISHVKLILFIMSEMHVKFSVELCGKAVIYNVFSSS